MVSVCQIVSLSRSQETWSVCQIARWADCRRHGLSMPDCFAEQIAEDMVSVCQIARWVDRMRHGLRMPDRSMSRSHETRSQNAKSLDEPIAWDTVSECQIARWADRMRHGLRLLSYTYLIFKRLSLKGQIPVLRLYQVKAKNSWEVKALLTYKGIKGR
jgi:hypothetical protein